MMKKYSKNKMIRPELDYTINGDRQLVILRGMPGSGKSTAIKNLNLEQHTLSQDTLRETMLPLVYQGKHEVINNQHNQFIFDKYWEVLEYRLKLGTFIVLDNLHTTFDQVKSVYELAKTYGYKVTIIQQDVPLDTLLERNFNRKGSKKYYSDSLEKRFELVNQHTKLINDKFNLIIGNYEDELRKIVQPKPYEISSDKYKSVKIIGDIHGSYGQLNDGLQLEQGLQDDIFYIFLGDYIDRGTENDKVLSFLIDNYDRENVVLLEGNHEIYLRAYVNNYELGYGKEFDNHTQPQIENAALSKDDLKKVVDQLRTHFQFTYNGTNYTCTHGGLVTDDVTLTSHFDRIFGHGDYSYDIDKAYYELQYKTIMFHGHRNLYRTPKEKYDDVFNLEAGVERGGELRIATIDTNGLKVNGYVNTMNKQYIEKENKRKELLDYVHTITEELGKGKERTTILNGTEIKNLYLKRGFDLDTKYVDVQKVRGLFYRPNGDIVLRGYDKYYNVGQVETLEEIAEGFNYQLTGYKKENGFLGLLSYDIETDNFLFATKNIVVNETTQPNDYNSFALEFRRIFFNTFNEDELDKIREVLILNNVTLTFEVISLRDKHIIEETRDKLVLLDGVHNQLEFKVMTNKQLKKVAQSVNTNGKPLELKMIGATFKNKDKFIQYVKNDIERMTIDHEGLVLRDNVTNKMVKYKSLKYFFYKEVRSIFQRLDKMNYTDDYIKNEVNKFAQRYSLTSDVESHQYLTKTVGRLNEVYKNKEKFMFKDLNNVERYDIPKIIKYVEENMI